MKTFHFTPKRIAMAAVAALSVVALGTAAFAYFGVTGSGGWQTQTGSTGPWLVTIVGESTAPLYPGDGSTVTAEYAIQNSGKGPQEITAVVPTMNQDGNGFAKAYDGTVIPNCLSSWFATSNVTKLAGTIVPGGHTVYGDITIQLNDSGTNQTACQGSTPAFTVSVS
ncbi:MAG TPA: hypothetical protein VF137_02475 [Candidatus Dormibacteraeota bacterium]